MKKSVAVIGAGGKMGARAAEKIGFSDAYQVLLCESNADRARALVDMGLTVTATGDAMAAADFVVMAVPDALIGAIRDKLLPLGDDITFVCGHGPGSSFGAERQTNPFLQGG